MITIKFISKISFTCSNIKRKLFKYLDQNDINHFRTILSSHSILTDPHDVEPYNKCFRQIDIGHSQLVLLPSTTQEVSKILKYCNQQKLAVVPQGGNTGLVGGSVPVFDQIIVNLQKMNKLIEFNKVSSVLTCEAGCVLQKLNQYLESSGFEVPLDLGAKGSCQIGGNVSTNAGGKYVVKYGSLRSHVLGLEAVLPNGQVLDLSSKIHKDNTGYDLKQLFISSQGTIGIITKLNIHCEKLDENRRIMCIQTPNYQDILKIIPLAKKKLGKQLNALQYMEGYTYAMVEKYLKSNILQRVEQQHHLLFIESPSERFEDLLEAISQEGIEVLDAILSNNEVEFKKIWKVREDVAVLARNEGKILSYDISFDVEEWIALTQELRKSGKKIYGYGHIGDGNIHINVVNESDCMQWHDQTIFKEVTKRKGSISAEHGVGLHKSHYLHLQKSSQVLRLLKQIKYLFDPEGIMNPYKVVPESV